MITRRKLLKRIEYLETELSKIQKERKLEKFIATNKPKYQTGPIGNDQWIVIHCEAKLGAWNAYGYRYDLFNNRSYRIVKDVSENEMTHFEGKGYA